VLGCELGTIKGSNCRRLDGIVLGMAYLCVAWQKMSCNAVPDYALTYVIKMMKFEFMSSTQHQIVDNPKL